jgi:hypothetical protein
LVVEEGPFKLRLQLELAGEEVEEPFLELPFASLVVEGVPLLTTLLTAWEGEEACFTERTQQVGEALEAHCREGVGARFAPSYS